MIELHTVMKNANVTMPSRFEDFLTPEESAFLEALKTPVAIQAFLDSTQYPAVEKRNRSPLSVIRERIAHCLDGGLFGALALRRLGYPPLIIDILPAPGTDDDHILAIFKRHACYGAVAKSNYSGLRFREPIYRTLRELVLSYFDDFYSIEAQKTLRAYTRPINLAVYDRYAWMWDDHGADFIEQRLWKLKSIPLITPEMAAELVPVDQRSYQAGMLGINPAGIYRPGQADH